MVPSDPNTSAPSPFPSSCFSWIFEAFGGLLSAIIEDARHPLKYRMLMPMVDCVFADVAQPDQAGTVPIRSTEPRLRFEQQLVPCVSNDSPRIMHVPAWRKLRKQPQAI